jgi:hypothetical protein
MNDTTALKLLRKHLDTLPTGEVTEPDALIDHLAGCWQDLEGSAAEGMEASKLLRMEGVRWEPPVLSFELERHGAIVQGGTRTEVQLWQVDLERGRATCEKSSSYRQFVPRAEQVQVEPIANEIAEAIATRRDDDQRLEWKSDGTVRVVISKVFPTGSGYKETVAGRRKRLRETLNRLLASRGWIQIGRDAYSRADAG